MASYASRDLFVTTWGLNESGEYTWKATYKDGRSVIFVADRTEPYLDLMRKACEALGLGWPA